MALKGAIKSAVPPALWTKLFKLRHEVVRGWLNRHQTEATLKALGSPATPLSGPFVGMRYLNEATGSAFFAKMLGTYEMEIRSAVDWLAKWNPEVLINVGCAEGYYAIGLAVCCPQSQIVAYDIESRARRLTRKLATINNVQDRVDIRRRCTQENLEPLLAKSAKSAIIIDCEGFEGVLLDPQKVPSLAKSVILVEAHDCFYPNVTQILRDRFSPTHEWATFVPRSRRSSDLPGGIQLDTQSALIIADEMRRESCWMLMIPKAIAAQLPPPPSEIPDRPAWVDRELAKSM